MNKPSDVIVADEAWSVAVPGKEFDPSICGVIVYQAEGHGDNPVRGCTSRIHLDFHRDDGIEVSLVPIQQGEQCTVVGAPRVRYFRWTTSVAKPNESNSRSSASRHTVEDDAAKTYAEIFDFSMYLDEPPPHATHDTRVRLSPALTM